MIKRIVFSICVFCAFQVSAQRVATLSIIVKDENPSVNIGEQVIMKVRGYNEETSMLQWQASRDGIAWKNISRATGEIFETGAITETQYFRVITRPNDGYLAVEEISNTQIIAVAQEVATMKKKKG